MTSSRVLAVGTSHPPAKLTRNDWLKVADRITPPSVSRSLLARLAENSTVDARWCASFEDDRFYPDNEHERPPGTAERMKLWWSAARDLSTRASSEALHLADIPAASITHCITASCTGFKSPGIDIHLIESLNMSRSCQRLNVGFMGCHAAVNGLAAARSIVRADSSAVVLICCVEICSAHFQRSTRLDHLIANTLFGDGAAAAIIAGSQIENGRRLPEVTDMRSLLIPETANEMGWIIADAGFEMTLSPRVPGALSESVGGWVRDVLNEHQLSVSDVGGWAIHPGGPRVIDAIIESIGLSRAAGAVSRSVLRDCGNMSSSTLLFILRALMDQQTPRPWVGLAFGPGLVGELVLLR